MGSIAEGLLLYPWVGWKLSWEFYLDGHEWM
jgi:hypothetical protein